MKKLIKSKNKANKLIKNRKKDSERGQIHSEKINKKSDFIIETKNFDLWYGDFQALLDINIRIKINHVTALIGPSGCGKTTLIRSFNRMNDVIDSCRTEGQIFFHGKDIFNDGIEVTDVRRRIGMVFQKPNPFPMSIYDNVAYGPRVHGISSNKELDQIVEKSIKLAALWDEVKDRLEVSALALSGGQQQRLCIARALSIEPEVILMDEPTSALDPIATGKIEDLINELKKKFTIIIVTHNMQQAARISDYTGFMYLGKMVEFNDTVTIFENPQDHLTENYITGRFG